MQKLAAGTILLALVTVAAAPAQTAPAVTVNGTPVAFDQPPVERVGRVYVPLRGVFERLGATVVYDAGQIAATRGSTTVSLHVGSTNAVVNGTPTTLDAPPFLVGARVLVPLRFVAQALGANVTYDGAQRLVAIGQQADPPPPEVVTPPPAPARLVRVEPEPNAAVQSLRPAIGATFPRPIDPNTVRIALDGRDVTTEAYVSPRAFSFDPGYDLPYGRHEVSVTAPAIAQRWAFTSAPVQNPNFLRSLSPPDGARVGDTFVVQGFTRPNSRVHIVVSANADSGFGEAAITTVTVDSGADPQGHFARPIRIDDATASVVDVRLESHAPDGAVVVRTLRLRP
ncbi:copper amine oxidase N-terminal domain-containing protein [Vulcanimicrobium alpinum]|nr:copper amine oxidase N-terminal domain-containing protein [Vulcanimicrobium alpinum]